MGRLFPHGVIQPPTGSCLPFWDEANHFHDPRIARAYRDLILITEGPLTNRARLAAILRWNVGGSPLDGARQE